MKIVIDIPERLWTKQLTADDYIEIVNAVANGTPLPKGHGDLIDRSEVIVSLFDYCKGKKTIGQCIDDVQTIISADKE